MGVVVGVFMELLLCKEKLILLFGVSGDVELIIISF